MTMLIRVSSALCRAVADSHRQKMERPEWGRVGLSAENPFKVSVGLFAR